MQAVSEPKKRLSKTKVALLKNCIQMLAYREWSDISIEEIEKKINKTRGAIFHHYKTKNELFKDAILYFFSRVESKSYNEGSFFLSSVKSLRDDFDIDNPEMAFFNITIQSVIRGIGGTPVLSNYKECISQEASIIGAAFIEIMRTNHIIA